MNIRSITKIGWINTIRLNFYYFGGEGLIHPRILASKYVHIRHLGGQVKTNSTDIGCIRIGLDCPGVIDEKTTRCVWENYGVIEFSGKAYIGAGTKIVNKGSLSFGTNCTITGDTTVICYKRVKIGNNSLVSWDCQISDTDFHKIYLSKDGLQANEDKDIIIGENVWIGSRSTILKGVIIPEGSVVAAGSIVSKSLEEPFSVYVSNNAVKHDVTWEK